MKARLLTTFAMMTVIVLSCSHHTDSDYETELAELKAEQAELRREYAELREEYLREKADFQKEKRALSNSVKKERHTKSVKCDTTIHQLTDSEMSKLSEKVKSVGLWPTNK